MGKPLRLLVVEDSEDDALLLVRELGRGGYEVTYERVDTAGALASALAAGEWDLVISDYSMPHFTGTAALELVKGTGGDVPFIFLSGTIGEETAVGAMRVGASDYIMKGNLARLLPAIDRELREAERRREHRRIEQQLRQAEKFETIGKLAGGIAHDFNNVIGVILARADLGRNETPPDSRAARHFQLIYEQARRAADLTRQLLAFARRQLLAPRNMNLNQLISDAASLLQSLIGEHIEIKMVLAPDLLAARADPTQVEQVLMNLCINARDAMAKGGQLVIETQNLEVDEEYARRNVYARPGGYVQLAVSDSGMGMDAATVDRIFEPFFTTKELGKGTGLGLATVYGIVKQHDGFINVYSEPGRGTTFRVYLPAASGAAERKETAGREPVRGGTETILVAEDHEGLREIAQEVLAALGYRILLARDGQEAVRLFAENRDQIRLVLLDVVMPVLGGPEAYDQITRMKPGVPVVFTTGYSAETALLKSVLEKGAAILPKPYESSVLAQKVREILDRGR